MKKRRELEISYDLTVGDYHTLQHALSVLYDQPPLKDEMAREYRRFRKEIVKLREKLSQVFWTRCQEIINANPNARKGAS